VLHLPDEVELARFTALVSGLMRATSFENKVLIRASHRAPVGTDVWLDVRTATMQVRFRLRVVRHARDAWPQLRLAAPGEVRGAENAASDSDGCERTDDVVQIDRVMVDDYDYHFRSTQDASFGQDAQRIISGTLPYRCSWLYFLSLFGHELERSQTCSTPGGFEASSRSPTRIRRRAATGWSRDAIWRCCELAIPGPREDR
jgi:hypothetical protein